MWATSELVWESAGSSVHTVSLQPLAKVSGVLLPGQQQNAALQNGPYAVQEDYFSLAIPDSHQCQVSHRTRLIWTTIVKVSHTEPLSAKLMVFE